jgi:hypothetical protein
MSNLRRLKNPNCATDAIMYDMHAAKAAVSRLIRSLIFLYLRPCPLHFNITGVKSEHAAMAAK